MLHRLFFDLRHALRSLRRAPGFSLLVVATLALGIGANVAIFEYLGYFVWPTVQAPEPDRLVDLQIETPQNPYIAFSNDDWLEMRRIGAPVFSQMTARRAFGASLRGPERTLYVWGRAVSGDYFEIFGKGPHIGRLLTPEDEAPGAERAMVLSYEIWERDYGADPDVLGTQVVLDGVHTYTIVGVTRRGFQGTGLWVGVYVPMALSHAVLPGQDGAARRTTLMARLADGARPEQAEAVFAGYAAELQQTLPDADADQAVIRAQRMTEAEEGAGDSLVFGASAMMWTALLLIALACANVANLFLARGASRRKEIGVSLALGAGRGATARRLLFESLALALAGTGLGLLLAGRLREVIHGYLRATLPIGFGDWSYGSSIYTQSWRLGLFVAALAIGTALLAGIAPVLQTWRLDLVSSLKADGAASGTGRRWGSRQVLVVVQVALSVVLLLTAGLLTRTLWSVRAHGLGFDPTGVTVASVHVPDAVVSDLQTDDDRGQRQARIYAAILDDARTLPGVEGASLTRRLPLTFVGQGTHLRTDAGTSIEVDENQVSEGYFETFRVPLLEGRGFTAKDDTDAPRVAIVHRTLAEQLWPGERAVGRVLEVSNSLDGLDAERVEVVGVVADHQLAPPTMDQGSMIYFPFRQRPSRRLMVVARARAATPLAQPMHTMLRDRYADVSIIEVVPFDKQRRVAAAEQRMNAEIAGGFGVLGLFLAGLGIFGVLAYGVARRIREFGIRMALGAHGPQIRRLVAGEAGRLLATGMALGVLGALGLGRVLRSVLWGVEALDPATFALVLAVLGAVGLVAAWIPALRAARVDPMVALRDE